MDHKVTVRPFGVEISAPEEEPLLTSLQDAGINVESICGGMGICGKCRIRVLEGNTSEPTFEEEDHLSEEMLEEGERLACQVYPLSDLVIHIPATSLTPDQKLQLETELPVSGHDPAIQAIDAEVPIITMPGEPGSDLRRVLEAVRAARPDIALKGFDLESLKDLPGVVRREAGNVRAVTRAGELLDVTSRTENPLGLAVDLGSTKVALFLYDLSEAAMLESLGFLNPQLSHGDDIITRLQFALEGDENGSKLMKQIVGGINENLSELLLAVGREAGDLYEMVLVGNTAMHHLFLGLPVRQLAMSPYLPAVDLPLEIKSRELGLAMNSAGVLYTPPPIAGFVGSDHLAALTATRLWERPGPCLLLDIGTNTEVALQLEGHISCCSCASGPAFEGGGISQGMRAGTGAIEQVAVDPGTGELQLSVVGDGAPLGICGSGILGAISSMLGMGAIDASGKMMQGHSRVRDPEAELCFYLSFPGEGSPQGVAISQADVREIQKAKGAIRAGIDVLLRRSAIDYSDLHEVILAGAFGSYVDPAAAVAISLLPPVSIGKITQVGNAAGAGARAMLLSASLRREAEALARRVEYVELAVYPRLGLIFAADMFLSEEEVENHKRRFSI